MKDKEKQIEEMAKVIDDRLIEANGYLGSMNKGEGYWIAQKLVEHYQPKLPEDSVVLSKEEKQEYENLVKDTKEQASKETAEKILQLAYDRCLEKRFIKKVEELAKQFGIEIKE